MRVGAVAETVGRAFATVFLVNALLADQDLQGFRCVELEIGTDAGRRVARRTIRRKNAIDEINLLIGQVIVAVKVEERELANGDGKSFAGQGVGVGDLRKLAGVIRNFAGQGAETAVNTDFCLTASFTVVQVLE